MLFLRKILFYLFIGIYLVFCPLTILYALGYLFKPGSEKGIVRTGLIYLSTAPSGASIYIGNKRYTRKTPAVLRDLLPGNYPVRLLLKDHQSWMETIPVEPEKATALERILLLPQRWREELLLKKPFEDLIPVAESPFFLLTRGPKIQDMILYDKKEQKSWSLLTPDSPYWDSKILSYFTIPESPFFILKVDSGGGEKFLRVEPRGKEVQMEDLTGMIPLETDRVEWDPRERRYLFAFHSGSLHRIDMVSKSLTPNFLEGIRGFGFSNGKIYTLTENLLFQRLDAEGKDRETLLDDPLLSRSLFGGRDFFRIKLLYKDVVLFWSEDGPLLSSRLPYRLIEEGVLGFEFYRELERVLLWQNDKLGLLDFSRSPKGEEMFEKGPKLIWIYQKGQRIEQAFWVYEGSHILFRDGDQLNLLELETYGKPHLHPILRVKKDSSVLYAEQSGTLYFLDRLTGYLSSLEILPRREILLLPFPEQKEEKKKSEIQAL